MKKITDPSRIIELAQQRKCVCMTETGRPIPAAVVQNFQFRLIVKLIKAGRLFEYKPKKKV